MELQHVLLVIIVTTPCITQCGPHFLRERYIRKLALKGSPASPECLVKSHKTEIHEIDYMSESGSSSEDIPFSESEESEKSGVHVKKSSEGLECCSIEDCDNVLNDSLSHDDFYIIDTALLLNYFHSWIDGWLPWLNEHYRLGKRVYVLDFVAQTVVDYNHSIPKYFQILHYEPQVSNSVMNNVLKQLKDACSITRDEWRWKLGVLQVDLLSLAIAGFAVDHGDQMQFPENDRYPSKVVYMTSPTTFYGRYISWPHKHKIFEDIVRSNGLGSLIQFRILHAHNGTWTDLPFGVPLIPIDWDSPDTANFSLPASEPLSTLKAMETEAN